MASPPLGANAAPTAVLEPVIVGACELSNWIAERLNGLEITGERRIFLAVFCYDVVVEHQVGITVLARDRINGSAFALVRPLFDTFVRGAWLRHCATDQQIDKYVKDRLDLKFGELLDQVESVDGFQSGVFSRLKKKTWRAMNSYTHGGIQQAGRRRSGAYIEPDFPPESVIEVIKLAGSFALLAFQQIVIEAKRMDLADEALQRLKVWG
jgi:hypothetical protein